MSNCNDTAPSDVALIPARQPEAAVRAMSTAVLRARTGAAGKCSDTADESYFPQPMLGTGARLKMARYARAQCAGCPVTGECLELALRIEARRKSACQGVWGATAPWERRALARERAGRLPAEPAREGAS
jgi:hypothetical protein